MNPEDLSDVQIPLADVVDLEILMHRDVHFGSNFDIMLDYYNNKGVGAMPDFSIGRIKELKQIEEKMGKNLSEVLLPSAARETIERAKKIYLDLREIYHQENPSAIHTSFSNLILTEEELPQEEISSIVKLGVDAVPQLKELLASQNFYDPLYPGYGRAPMFAAKCLAEIGDESAIPVLFEAIGQDNFFTDDEIIKALGSFGDKAKEFLLKIVKQEPLSKDNDHAAIAIAPFSEDADVATLFLDLLSKETVQKRVTLAPYLIFGCSALSSETDRQHFKQISKSPHISSELKLEMDAVINGWKK